MIKKHPNNNHYLRTQGGIWVRNPFLKALPFDINDLMPREDANVCIGNEFKNAERQAPDYSIENWDMAKVVVVGDGVDVRKKLKLLNMVPKGVKVIAVNDGLNEWDMRLIRRAPDLYVINNPYEDAVSYLPKKNRPVPRCLASIRTNSVFVEKYPGQLFTYTPTPSSDYNSNRGGEYLDDYRNPVAAAVSFAAKHGLRRLLLVACDASFKDKREGSEQLPNGLYQYPKYNQAHHMLDGMLYWLAERGVKVADSSSGPKLEHAEYIQDDQWLRFFTEDGKIEGRLPKRR